MRLPKHLLVLLCSFAACLSLACGTPGAPQPPSLQLPRPVENLAAERKGTRVLLSWAQPTQTTDKQNVRHLGVTRICRSVDEFPMAICREVVKELGPTEMTSQTTGKGANPRVLFEDLLSPQAMGERHYAGYAVEVFNDRNKTAGLSNQIRVPLAPTLPIPTDLKVDVTSNGPVLHWAGQSRAQLGKLAQAYEFHYRIYRRLSDQPNYTIVGEVPLNGPQFVASDPSFEWEKTYIYKVTPVTAIPAAGGVGASEIEGDDSSPAQVTVHDVFPPARPTGLQAVYSGVGQKAFIDLSWAPNTESDLAGYTVYRHEKDQPPIAISKEPAKGPSFRDDGVEAGHTYYYFVQAADVRGNLSESSQEASESVPGGKQ
jgi:hypothetical protein